MRTINPILKDDQVVTNDALLGKWVTQDGKGQGELTKDADGHYLLHYTEGGKDGQFVVRMGKIGDVDVAEIKADAFAAHDSDEYKSLLIPLYNMAVIRQTSPNLVITGPSFDWWKKYAQEHPDELEMISIAGQETIVGSSTEKFQTFFTKHFKDPGMLGDDAVYIRPGDATTQPAK